MDAIEVPFKREVYRERNRYIAATAEDYRRTRSLSDRLFNDHAENINAIFNKYYKRAMVYFTSEASRQLDKERKLSLWEALLARYVAKDAGRKAQEVAGTTREDIRRIIARAYEDDGATEDAVIKALLTSRGLSAFRATTIARTETHAAAMFASLGTAQSIARTDGLTLYKIWNATGDDRTREDHALADGQKVGLNEDFSVGGESISAPGEGSPENAINCRCVLTYEGE